MICEDTKGITIIRKTNNMALIKISVIKRCSDSKSSSHRKRKNICDAFIQKKEKKKAYILNKELLQITEKQKQNNHNPFAKMGKVHEYIISKYLNEDIYMKRCSSFSHQGNAE